MNKVTISVTISIFFYFFIPKFCMPYRVSGLFFVTIFFVTTFLLPFFSFLVTKSAFFTPLSEAEQFSF